MGVWQLTLASFALHCATMGRRFDKLLWDNVGGLENGRSAEEARSSAGPSDISLMTLRGASRLLFQAIIVRPKNVGSTRLSLCIYVSREISIHTHTLHISIVNGLLHGHGFVLHGASLNCFVSML